jgi:uncharacterized membrane protein (TIGR02234 family)
VVNTRRSFAVALLLGLAGGGLAIFGATRTWSLQVIVRSGLPDLRTARTGADDFPLLIGLALVALAGSGALLATRGVIRRVVGGLLAVAGAGVILQTLTGRIGLDIGRAGGGATTWPIVCVLGGAMIVAGGVAAAAHGHRWPTMGARYERRSTARPSAGPVPGTRPPAAAEPGPASSAPGPGFSAPSEGPGAGSGTAPQRPGFSAPSEGPGAGSSTAPGTRIAEPAPTDTRAVWDALDRGEDPTAG